MADYHFSVTQIKRSAGQSAIACAAYRAGEKLHSDYYGEDSDYTKKKGVAFRDILLPVSAPSAYSDREMLWNAVEKAEKHPKAQREIRSSALTIALPMRWSLVHCAVSRST